ncbi:TauD/TfdA family dioxygenase [Streptomyces naphthomycinicus]|uniref:TauD/TfdA family dioxygenase n=1 Tax=Streptomyces naphthomycinicus TaxID=2872625 RepID=UPI001CECD826|nr:TauD/TfdA family dioxygenase [Streptomyces sp. TML10]
MSDTTLIGPQTARRLDVHSVPGPVPMLTPVHRDVDVLAWAAEHRDTVGALLTAGGALVLRGFPVTGQETFEQLALALSASGSVAYRENATPRSHVAGNTYTSTDYPADRTIYAHNENSHTLSWPGKLFFYCATPAATGGETPVTDCRAVLRRIPGHIRDRFLEEGWLYRRSFSPRLGIGWRQAFGVETPDEAHAYAADSWMDAEFDGDRLVVRYRRWAAVDHPGTGEPVWFNHGTFFNQASLEPELRRFATALGVGRLPYNTFHGNGDPVSDEVVDILRKAYEAETTSFTWERGDILMIDNMLVAHGRRPFTGERRVLVTMTEQMAAAATELPGAVAVRTIPQAGPPVDLPAV